MSTQTLPLTPGLYRYLLENSLREAELLTRVRTETARHKAARMQIAPEQGQFMALLVRLMKVQTALEIGVFTGYSALCVALALPPGGQLVALDNDPETAAIAQRYFTEGGVAERVELRVGDAMQQLDRLATEGANRFDFAFIDADKENYAAYFERAIELIRPGGLILVDNVLWKGRVADPSVNDPATRALRHFNRDRLTDPRIELSLLPLADGLTLALKR